MGNILLAEFYTSHLELINSHVEMLKANGHNVHLCFNEVLRSQGYSFKKIENHFYISYDKRISSMLKAVKFLNGYIDKHKIDKIIINTAEGRFVALFSHMCRKNTDLIGTLHHTNKLKDSFQQKIINMKIKRYFVLSNHLAESINNKKFNIEPFYPVFFPATEIQKKTDEFIVCIPGGMEQKRKDIFGIVDAVIKNSQKLLNLNIKFVLLGNISGGDGPEILKKIKEEKIEPFFIYFEEFVLPEKFYQYLSISDIVLPLIHKNTKGFNEYTSSRISGTFNSAFGFKKTMLMEKSFSNLREFKDICIFYEEKDLIDSVINLYNNRDIVEEKTRLIEKDIRFDYNYQKEQYEQLIYS